MEMYEVTWCPCAPDETNLPADIPSYLSSQGTLAERQDSYIPSESGSSHQYMASSISGFYLQPKDMNGTTPLLFFFVLKSNRSAAPRFSYKILYLYPAQVFVRWIQEVKQTWRHPLILCSAIIKVLSAHSFAGTTCTPLTLQKSSQVFTNLIIKW